MSEFCMCCGELTSVLGKLLPFGTLCHSCNAWDDIEYMRPNKQRYYVWTGHLYYMFRDFGLKPTNLPKNFSWNSKFFKRHLEIMKAKAKAVEK